MIARSASFKQLQRTLSIRSVVRLAPVLLLLLACANELAAQAGYGGPSLLSRGGNRPGQRGRAPVDFAAYLGIRGLTESGLLTSTLEDGTIVPVQTYGGSVEAGLYGGHEWRRSSFGIDYRGDYRRNTNRNAIQFNGFNQAVSLEYRTQITRRLGLSVTQTGGVSNRAFGAFAAPAFGGMDRLGIPLNEIFDIKTYFSQTGGAVSYQKSARIVFVGQGQGFFIKRQNASLINGQGFVAGGQVFRRQNRRSDIGLQYQFFRFEFPRVFSNSDSHSVAGLFRRQWNRNWNVSLLGGVIRSAVRGTQTVILSPEVAFILGRPTGVEAFSVVRYLPQVEATVAYVLQQSRLSFNYSRGLANGNGVLLTAERQTANAGYSYAGIRRTSLGASAGWSVIDSIGLNVGKISNYQAGLAGSYKLAEHLDFTAQADYRTFSSPGLRGREGYIVSIGLNYTTSRLPLSIW